MYKLASLIQAQRYNFMRYEVKYNQLGLIEYNTNNPGKELDFTDAILLMELYKLLSEWDAIEKKNFNQKEYFWIAYNKILDELPTLGIKTNDALYRRLKIIERFGLIEKETVQTGKENRKTYFRLTPIGLQTVTLRMDDRNPYGWQTVTPTDGKPDNKITINKKTNDERERTLFDFLNEKYSEEINSLKEKFPLPADQWEILIDDFNQKGYSKRTVTVTTFRKLLMGYKRIEDKKRKEEPIKQPYLRKLS